MKARFLAADKIVAETEQMRKLQKQYFKTRDRDVLTRAKIQEGKVDDLINDYKQRQTRMKLGLPD